MSRLLHLSDTHFGTEQAPVVAALRSLAHALQPDLIVVSGDITQRATAEQFAAARAFFDSLPAVPKLLLPGNHDIPLFALWQRLLTPYARYRRGLRVQPLAPQMRLPDLQLFAVKSTRRRRHIDGEISAAQIEAVRAALATAPRQALKVVVTHQPLWVERAEDLHNRCHGADAALSTWVEAGADLFLAGHIHWPFAAALPQRRTAWAVNAGTAVSHRVRPGAPNSVNLIDFEIDGDARRLQLSRYDCLFPGAAFECISRRTLALA